LFDAAAKKGSDRGRLGALVIRFQGLHHVSDEKPDSRFRTHCGSQKMTVAAMQMADMKVWAQRS
jgi:hypothetical protein